MTTLPLLVRMLQARCDARTLAWAGEARAEIALGVSDERFCAVLSLASRNTPRRPLAPTAAERDEAGRSLEGWDPERWTLLEALRAVLVLGRKDLAEPSAERALEEAFRYADEGELCALHRVLAHLPDPERFSWRAREGCRSNMRDVFEAAALDTPFPARWFDEVSWRAAAIKSLFVGAPLWRLAGLDQRLDPELARMALDLADERRSAQREVQHELWLCLGRHGGERGRDSLTRELEPANAHTLGRKAAAFGLARAGEATRLRELAARERDPAVAEAMRAALQGPSDQTAFRRFDAEAGRT